MSSHATKQQCPYYNALQFFQVLEDTDPIILTHKQTLVHSDLPIISDVDHLSEAVVHGFVKEVARN